MFGHDAAPHVLRQVLGFHPSHTREVQIGLFGKNKEVLLCFICLTPKTKPTQNQEEAPPLSRGVSLSPEWTVKGSPPAWENLHI